MPEGHLKHACRSISLRCPVTKAKEPTATKTNHQTRPSWVVKVEEIYKRKRKADIEVAFDIEHAARIIESSTAAALKRMRQADEKLEIAQRATRDKESQLAEALKEYARCVAELVDYLNIASRRQHANNKEG